jgi:membrane-bound lytic murein transglycosylase MltF
MAKTIGNNLELFRRLPKETKTEFGWRLKTAIQGNEASNPAIAESFTNIAGLLEIDLTKGEEIAPESSLKSDED